MSISNPLAVSQLTLDLKNFRTIVQASESDAIEAMIAISPDRFWALMQSLLDDGYLPTENILVLDTGGGYLVKEGNRRIAALKLALGVYPNLFGDVPANIVSQINGLSPAWKSSNSVVPCTIFAITEIATVDKLITLTHGKAVKAARDQWTAVARARHNREVNQATESALDLLEKFLGGSRLVSSQQRNSWSGDYPLTVLDEAIKRLAPRLGFGLSTQLVASYPNVQHRAALDAIIHDIGLGTLGFPKIRKTGEDFADAYGIPKPAPAGTGGSTNTGSSSASSAGGGASAGPQSTGSGSSGSAATQASAVGDQKSVRRILRKLKPKGQNRAKVVSLIKEMLNLNIDKNPLAFCFLLRSSFEIAAKAYCDDHKASGGPSATHANGNDRQLIDVLNDVASHLTNKGLDKARVRLLHGATTELGKSNGILSVTSMNQLIHHPQFSVQPSDICIMFGNVVPLLEAMC